MRTSYQHLTRFATIRAGQTTIGIGLVAFAATIMLGWMLHWPRVVSLDSANQVVVFNSALLFLLGGSAVLITALCKSSAILRLVLGIIISTLGAIALTQSVTETDLGISWSTLHAWLPKSWPHLRGSMNFNPALCFVSIGLALALMDRVRNRHAAALVRILMSIAIALPALDLIGKLIDLDLLYPTYGNVRMSIGTACAMLALVGGVWLVWWQTRWMRVRPPLSANRRIAYASAWILAALTLAAGISTFSLMMKLDVVEAYAPIRERLPLILLMVLVFAALGVATIHFQLAPLARRLLHTEQQARTFNRALRDKAAALEASQRQLRTITDNLPILISYIDCDQRYRFCNSFYKEIFGLQPDEMLGKTIQQAHGTRAHEWLQDKIREALSGMPVSFEQRITFSGGPRYLHITYLPDFAEDSSVIGFFLLGRDITSEKQTAQALIESEQRLSLLANNIPALIAYVDSEERFSFGNYKYEEAYGVSHTELKGKSTREVLGDDVYMQSRSYMHDALSGTAANFERTVTLDQSFRVERVSYIPDVNYRGHVTGFFSLVEDITDLKRIHITLAESQKRLRTITDNVPALICYIDRDRRFQFNNRTYAEWLKIPLDQITGRRVSDVYDAKTYNLINPHIERAFTGHETSFQLALGSNGDTKFYRGTYLPHIDDKGEILGVYGLTNDITPLKLVEKQLTLLAKFDTLTGLANRNQFNETLVGAIARSKRSGLVMAVIFLDIDHFKSINDQLGHRGGDDVLAEFAKRLKHCVRETDTVARLAGDEFVIILEGLHAADEPELVAEKIISAMEREFVTSGATRKVTTSIGIALRRDQETDPAALLHRADEALYRAKAAGRNTFRISNA